MAEGLLRNLSKGAGVDAQIRSAGLLPGGAPPTPEAIAVMADQATDIAGHVSRALDAEAARSASLVIGMTRHHVREAVVTYGSDIERTFTLKELVRRGEEVGPRHPDETLVAWLARVGSGRRTVDLMGDDEGDDIADPVGRPRSVYEATARELETLLRQLVVLLVGGPRRPAAPTAPSRPARERGGVVAAEASGRVGS
jgi:protein-tyrosine phosphatase